MATIITSAPIASKPLAADILEKILAGGALVLLGAVVIALGKGRSEWGEVPMIVWLHLATIGLALALTPVMLLRKRGDALHKNLGRAWVIAMFLTALFSLDIHLINRGGFSIIHILSIWTMIQLPIIYLSARNHNIARHRRSVRGMVIGALLVAGFFTFPFNRLMGQWLFG
jgi:uncharacterized membrane protein